MWDFSLDELLFGVLGAGLVIAIVVAVCWLWLKSGNKAAAKFKSENPDTATIWIAQRKFWGVKIKKADGSRVKSFQNGMTDGSGGTYILPGEHVLTLEHIHADPAVNKNPEYKKQRISAMKVSLERGKDYILQFDQQPGVYSLVEGKPEGE